MQTIRFSELRRVASVIPLRSLSVLSLLWACGGSSSALDPSSVVDGGTDASSGTSGATGDGGGSSVEGTDAGPGSGDPDASPGTADGGATTSGRDWKAYPAIVDLPAPKELYALSDVHGGFDRLITLLGGNNLIDKVPTSSKDAHWAAGNAVLVVAGDMIDKGPAGVEVLDFLMALQADAKKAGGGVVVTIGNHEAEFLVDPSNSKATGPDGIVTELSAKGISPADVASGVDPRGAWIRRLPFGARFGGWFFSHAGDTQGRSVDELSTLFEAAVKNHPNYDAPEIVGTTSILESRDWYTDPATATKNAAALGVKHIVFGHDPSALGPKGKIAVAQNEVLTRIDCGMSPTIDYSKGMIFHITQQGTKDVAEQLDPKGKVTPLFSSPR